MKMIDFSKYPLRKKMYEGANGQKLSIVIDDELYMLKFPSRALLNKNISYANSCVSEYLGSHIFNMLKVEAQETILGTYVKNDKSYIAVACKDFEKNGFVLKNFAGLKNQVFDSSSNGYGTELNDILSTIENQNIIDPVILLERFWDMFVIDALIGNWDRHNGNWGLLYNTNNDEAKIAPVFDCGSCLYPQLDENLITKILNDENEIKARIYNVPTSAILLNGKRINYYNFIKSNGYRGLSDAIDRLNNRIVLNDIYILIDDISCISDSHKELLKLLITKRYNIFFKNGV